MRGPGLGLTSMKERLKVVGGSFPSTRSGGTARRFTLSRRSVPQRGLQMEPCNAGPVALELRGQPVLPVRQHCRAASMVAMSIFLIGIIALGDLPSFTRQLRCRRQSPG